MSVTGGHAVLRLRSAGALVKLLGGNGCIASTVSIPVCGTWTKKSCYFSSKPLFRLNRDVYLDKKLLFGGRQGGVSLIHWRDFRKDSVFEPGYLDPDGPVVPSYDVLNVQLKGYDFTILETYGKYVHNTSERLGISVEDSWAAPCKNLRVTKLKPESTVVETEYKLHEYERNVQLTDIPSTMLPILLSILEATLPPGVSLSVHPHEPEFTEVRYIPDTQLNEMKAQLEDMGGPSRKRK